jgi:histidinol dehydrogenase
MIKILDSNKKNFYTTLNKIINKRKNINKSNLKSVERIINNVRKNKDKALVYYEKKFNNNSKIIPSKKEITKAIKLLDPKIKRAIDDTYKRVKNWHSKQKPRDIYYKDELGNKFYYRNKAIESVACYVPSNLP